MTPQERAELSRKPLSADEVRRRDETRRLVDLVPGLRDGCLSIGREPDEPDSVDVQDEKTDRSETIEFYSLDQLRRRLRRKAGLMLESTNESVAALRRTLSARESEARALEEAMAALTRELTT